MTRSFCCKRRGTRVAARKGTRVRLCGKNGGEGWIRTTEGISQQIYSLPRLATSVPLHYLICLGNLDISSAEIALCLTVVTFCVTVWLLRELMPDESGTKDGDEPAVHIEIEVDEGRSVSLPLQVNKCISAR